MIEILKPLRTKIDSIDEELVTLLVKREQIVRDVAQIKEEHGIAVILPERIEEVIAQATAKATAQGGTDYYVRNIYKRIIELSCDLENHLMDDKNTNS